MGSWDNGRHASPDPQTHSDNYIECACALSNLLEAVAIDCTAERNNTE